MRGISSHAFFVVCVCLDDCRFPPIKVAKDPIIGIAATAVIGTVGMNIVFPASEAKPEKKLPRPVNVLRLLGLGVSAARLGCRGWRQDSVNDCGYARTGFRTIRITVPAFSRTGLVYPVPLGISGCSAL